MTGSFHNKTILIAGAGGLLGGALVREAIKEGAHVIAADISIEKIKSNLNITDINTHSNLLTYKMLDITDESSVKSLFESFDKPIQGAVNATYPRNNTYGVEFMDVTLNSFNENLALHLGSAFLFTQQCAKYFKKFNTDFSLVNIASIYGVIAPKFEIYNNTKMTMPVEYAAIKSAIIHLNKYVASYVRNSNFRINSISPGGILDGQNDEFIKSYRQNTLGKGMLNVNDVTGTILYLLSNSSRYINGQNIIIDDGFVL